MINVLTCIKIVPDLDMLTNISWDIDQQTQRPDTSFLKKGISSYDNIALEMALKLKDAKLGDQQPIELCALTIGEQHTDLFLKNLFALNYDKAVRVSPPTATVLSFNPLAIASIITGYQQIANTHNMIMLGTQSDDEQNGQTAMLLAEKLNWPCISKVTHIELTDNNNQLDITSQHDELIIKQRVTLPVVVSIGDVPDASTLRIPTLKAKLNAAKKQIEHYCVEQLNIDPLLISQCQNKQYIALSQPKTVKECVEIKGNTPQEKAAILYQYYVKARVKE